MDSKVISRAFDPESRACAKQHISLKPLGLPPVVERDHEIAQISAKLSILWSLCNGKRFPFIPHF